MNEIHEEAIPIKGMHCKSCINSIESELLSLKGVKTVKASLTENNAVVQFNPREVSLDEIKSKIISLGYSIGTEGRQEKSGLLQGLIYGLVPHAGCIGFIVASLVGATAAMSYFKPLLMNPYFFYILVFISLGFATASSFFYLRRNKVLSLPGIKRKWRYLSVMYGSTVGVNLLVFMVVFPLLADATVYGVLGNASVQLQVSIPCPGHAPLIMEELRSVNGVGEIEFSYPNYFDVTYDFGKTTVEEILSLEVFDTYKATVVEPSSTVALNQQGCCTSGSGGCGGCGSPKR